MRLSQLPELIDEFFGLGYRDNRLGFQGTWSGSDISRLKVDHVVDRETFGNIFSFRSPAGDKLPSRDWREGDPLIARWVRFTGNPLVSTLWGLGSAKHCQALLETRYQATAQAMKLLQSVAVMESESKLPLLGRGCLYAAFLTGAAPDQTPQLEMNILVAQQYRLPNGKEVHFPLALSQGVVTELINRLEWRLLSEKVGTFGLTKRTLVPTHLFSPPVLAEILPRNERLPGSVSDRRLAGAELIRVWRDQAECRGFGREKVERLFAAGKLLSNIVGWDRNTLGAEGIRAAYHAVARTGSRLSKKEPDKTPDHGPSL